MDEMSSFHAAGCTGTPPRAGSHHPVTLRVPPLLGQEGSVPSSPPLTRRGGAEGDGAVWCMARDWPSSGRLPPPRRLRRHPSSGRRGESRRQRCEASLTEPTERS